MPVQGKRLPSIRPDHAREAGDDMLASKSIGPWRSIALLALVGVAVIAVSQLDVLGSFLHDLILGVGTALLIAAILAATVDRWLKRALVRDAFHAVFGYMLPAELRDEVGWLYGQELLCDAFELRVTLRPTDDPNLLTLAMELSREFRNVATHPVSYEPLFALDDWFHPDRPSRVFGLDASRDGTTDQDMTERREGPDGIIIVGRLAKVLLKPGERVTFVAEGEETRHVNDALFMNLIHATSNPRVTVDAPDGIGFQVMYGFSRTAGAARTIGRRTWQLQGTLIPGHVIQVRWWQIPAHSSGDGQATGLVSAQGTRELGEDLEVGVQPDPTQPPDTE